MSAVGTSKFLSLVLRHDPRRIGIVLDEAGWTDVGELLAALAAHGHALTRTELAQIVATSDKQRFALSPDGARIRANQGHSVEVELELEPATPPARLYHGTVTKFVRSIRADGLIKGARHHVHLSADVETATKVGSRRGKPVLLTVRADEMVGAGHVFHRSANGVWLADHVPAAYLDFPAPELTGERVGKAEIARTTLAACNAGGYTNARDEHVDLADAIQRCTRGTRLYDAATYAGAVRSCAWTTEISVTAETTIAAIRRLADRRGHLACLNFASARNPGGGFLAGAQAQEESLARSSALYPCQLEAPEHYRRNRAHGSPLYLDLALWSPHVPFFRADDGAWLDAPVACSVITCAAPNAGALRQHRGFDADTVEAALRRRGELVFSIARDHCVDRLVLGAWGAGVFGNDPAMVAHVFADLLRGPFASTFAEVVFAIIGGPGRPNHDAFATVFVGPR